MMDYSGLLWIRVDPNMKNKDFARKNATCWWQEWIGKRTKLRNFGPKNAGMLETMLEDVWKKNMMET